MAVPKRRCSQSKKGRRRSHDFARPLVLQHCSQCGEAKPSHVVCPKCGVYQGRLLVVPKKAD